MKSKKSRCAHRACLDINLYLSRVGLDFKRRERFSGEYVRWIFMSCQSLFRQSDTSAEFSW